ncbi:hypothetical protein THAOC_03603 [Thalassiosira oceanica]|uniref:Uncharacterized protein n=1 Tax=Thalassiosira oceanica TaxID=159749 RepID=K0T7J3_THAOC|nr:hypothetical protein THAOC_03603 [Thalassiosira oceanica]|eukprot:EJK74703.1 hypothetical protein THAOC_03603 [Thalassiosira oceanica]
MYVVSRETGGADNGQYWPERGDAQHAWRAGQRHGAACGAPNLANGQKLRPKQLRPVNTSRVRQAKPTTQIRSGMIGMIQIYLAGMSSIGWRPVNACAQNLTLAVVKAFDIIHAHMVESNENDAAVAQQDIAADPPLGLQLIDVSGLVGIGATVVE